MNRNSIAGFNRISKTGGNTWNLLGANNKLYCMSLRWERLKKRIQSLRAYEAYARLEESIGFDSDTTPTTQLKKLVKSHFSGTLITQSAKAFDLVIASLEEGANSDLMQKDRGIQDLIEDLVKLIHQTGMDADFTDRNQRLSRYSENIAQQSLQGNIWDECFRTCEGHTARASQESAIQFKRELWVKALQQRENSRILWI